MFTEPTLHCEFAVDHVRSVERVGAVLPVLSCLSERGGGALHAVRYSSEGETRTLFHSVEIAALEVDARLNADGLAIWKARELKEQGNP